MPSAKNGRAWIKNFYDLHWKLLKTIFDHLSHIGQRGDFPPHVQQRKHIGDAKLFPHAITYHQVH